MRTTTVVVIGAGQAGLAMSRELSERSIDHVVLERADVANSWRTERWDSLRLLTPNWLTRLPGWAYDGADPDGYMTATELADALDRYRRAIAAPVQTSTTVLSIQTQGDRHLVATDQGLVACRSVVIATGACASPRLPALARELPAHLRQVTPASYRRPDDLDDGPVLVVGASASGVQLADELRRSGRAVTLSVGAHTRAPRTYRGRDIHWWMDVLGLLDTRYDKVDDLHRARRLPSLQLIGTPERRTLDLHTLGAAGVELVGRLAGITGRHAQFSGSLPHLCADADLKMGRLLDQIDRHVEAHDLDVADDERPPPTTAPAARTIADLSSFATVIWATGHAPTYPWLDAACLDRRGAVVHDGGVLPSPGMYVLGLPFMRTRTSNFIGGVGRDAAALASHLHEHLHRCSTAVRSARRA